MAQYNRVSVKRFEGRMSSSNTQYCVSKSKVVKALKEIRLKGVRETPFIHDTSKTLQCGTNINLMFKCESFQRSGSFKFRGATNAVCDIAKKDSQKRSICVTVSSGNFAQGLALASQISGFASKIVMPINTTKIKIDAVKSYGAEIEFCHPNKRDEHCAQVVEELGTRAQFVHPSEDPRVIAGNGTLMLEMIQQSTKIGKKLHAVICPVGGGGVISGVSAVCHEEGILVIGGEPLNADDAYRSKQSGAIQGHRITGQTPTTIAEGLRTTLGPNTFPCVRDWVDTIILVSEDEIKQAMRLVLERLKVVTEASSCVAYAVARKPEFIELMKRKFPNENEINVGIVLTGGNVDFTEFFSKL